YSRISARSGIEAFEMFKDLGINGMNITTPLKNDILPFADQTDESTDRTGGVNSLLNDAGTIRGYNTDHLGVSRSLAGEDIAVKGKKCLVLGAGMSGRSAVYALQRMGGNVTIINRTFKKAHILAGNMNCNSAVFEKLQSELSESDIFVSALTSGTEIVKESWLKKSLIVFDANYPRSPLSEKALSAGCKVLRGEKWLLNQAIPSFRIFTGQDISRTETEKISGLLGRQGQPVSSLIIAGDKKITEDLRFLIDKNFRNMEITTISDPYRFETEKKSINSIKNPLILQIYSGSIDREKKLFPYSDLIIWGKDGIEDCADRTMREIDNVL
ncbi:MAG: hypothetical protein ABFR36_02625, partial [Acidobacteriota bacterium]